MFKKFLITLFSIISLSACQSTLMEPVTEQALTNAKTGKAQMVFMRSSFVGQAIQASLFDITTGNARFIGIISDDTKITYDVAPGEHMFMVIGESADFLKANVAADQTYYSVVTPRMGFWKARFSMHPVRHDKDSKFSYGSEQINKILAKTKLVKSGVKAENWAKSNASDITSKLTSYLPKWKGKSLKQISQATIEESDYM